MGYAQIVESIIQIYRHHHNLQHFKENDERIGWVYIDDVSWHI